MGISIEKFSEELSSLIRARYPLLYVNTFEETRAVALIGRQCEARESVLFVWSRTAGITKNGKPVSDITDPMAVLKWYEETQEKSVLVLKDYHPFLKDAGIVRKLRDLGHLFKRFPKNVIVLSPVVQVPPELCKEMVVLDLPLPNRSEIEALVQKASAAATHSAPDSAALVDAASGLTLDEIENVLARSLVSKGSLDCGLVQEEKKQIVRRSGLLEFIDLQENEAEVGGLETLRDWLSLRKKGLSAEARALSLPVPKGILLVGVPGCGKSLTAVTVGKQWKLPLLRLDLGRIFSGLVGSSEGNIRSAIQTCEAVSPCILWIDEIEKGLSGTKSSGQSDGGTTSRVFGTLLTWMQEKKSTVFVLATANDISQLPPEFLRKGRFDEIFFVDLPSAHEREQIFGIQMKKYGWTVPDLRLETLVEKTDGFSGSEIEQSLVAGRYLAFGKDESFVQAHIEEAVHGTVPLSKTMQDRIEALRSWASFRARNASRVVEASELFARPIELASSQDKKAGTA